jgi:hypothetical protein
MHYLKQLAAGVSFISLFFAAGCRSAHAADASTPQGSSSFGPDQTITDINKVEWQALKLEGLPPGIEVAPLRGDLAKGRRRNFAANSAKLYGP